MIQTLTNNLVLLGLCGILEAAISGIYLSQHSSNSTIVLLGKLSIAAGVLTLAVAVWRSATGKCWFLAANGLALGSLGIIGYALTHFQISFLNVALLGVAMAIGVGVTEWNIAQTWPQRQTIHEWLLPLTEAGSTGFVLAFLALGFGWMKPGAVSRLDLLLLGLYFAFSALWKIGLALRLRRHRHSEFGERQGLSPLRTVRHAH